MQFRIQLNLAHIQVLQIEYANSPVRVTNRFLSPIHRYDIDKVERGMRMVGDRVTGVQTHVQADRLN